MKNWRVFLAFIALAAGTVSGQAGVFDTWNYRMKVSFSSYAKPETLTNFPALVVLSTNITGFRYGDFKSTSGGDLRFGSSNQTAELNYEIERWDTNGTSYVWVQMPTLASTNDFIYAYWGRTTNTPAYTTNGATWSDGFAAVWHFASTNVLDSSQNRYHGTNSGATSAGGQIGDGLSFNGSSSVNMGDVVNPSSITVSAWVRWNSAAGDGANPVFVGKNNSYEMVIQKSNSNFWWAHSRKWAVNATSFTVTTGNWAYLVMSYGSNTGTRAYANGTQVGTDASTGALSSSGTLKAGVRGDNNLYYAGLLDELSISTVPRSSNWVWACYVNQASNSTFVSYGLVAPVATSLAVWADAPTTVTTNSAALNGTVLHAGNAENPQAYVCWDQTDRGTNALTDWSHAQPLGTNWGIGQSFSTNITGLIAGSNYAYRCYVTNSTGQDWSDTAVTFSVPYMLLIQGSPANYGSPLPNGYGANLIQVGATVTNGVASPTNASSTLRQRCIGWNTTLLSDGSPVGSGVGTQAVVQMTNNLALTWNWTNEWYLTLTNSVGGTNEAKAGWYTNATQVSVSAFPTGSYHFIGWVGDVPAGAATNNPITVTMNQAPTLRSQFSTLFSNFTLIVTGSPTNYGLPAPLNYGTYTTNILDGSWITNSVPSPTNATTILRRTCLGWTLAYTNGTLLSSAPTTQAIFQLNASERLTWIWTNECYLSVSAATGGTITAGTSAWYTNGTQVTLAATQNVGFTFLQWLGNVPAGSETLNPLTVTMDQGRDAVALFVANSVNETKVWSGNGNWPNGTNWTGGTAPGPEDDAIIRTGTNVLTGPVHVNSLVISNGAAIQFNNWDSILTVAGDVTICSNGSITLPAAFNDVQPSNNIYIVCSNLTILSGGKIDALGKGYGAIKYYGGYGPSGNHGRDGAGHGGQGGPPSYSPTYGSSNAPILPGSGGGSGAYADLGGNGGGAVRVQASGLIRVNGSINASGTGGSGGSGNDGGGSGGSVYLVCNALAGTNGSILANGGGPVGASNCGGAGGGRIAVQVNSSAQAQLGRPDVQFSTLRDYNGDIGTVYLSDSLLIPQNATNLNGQLYGFTSWKMSQFSFNNGWIRTMQPGLDGLVVSNFLAIGGATNNVNLPGLKATLEFTNTCLVCSGDMVASNAQVTICSGFTNSTATNTGFVVTNGGNLFLGANLTLTLLGTKSNCLSCTIQATNLNLDYGAVISADGAGFGGGGGTGTNGYGPGGGLASTGGGGYGGRGGDPTKGGSPYGSSNAPVDPGSGGGGNGGRGGGLVSILTGTATLNGRVSASGTTNANAGGGGSGGGIFIQSDTIAASYGVLRADGTNGYSATYGGGGGGRIATLSRANGFAGTFSVLGGGGNAGYTGDTGTVVQGTMGGFLNLNIEGSPARHGVINASPVSLIYGDNGVASGTLITASVPTPADTANGQRFSCLGWSLSNNVGPISSGTTTQAIFTVSTNLYLVWYWTNEWQLTAAAPTNGTLQQPVSGWYTNGTLVTVTPVASSGFQFSQWTGWGVPAGGYYSNPLVAPMIQMRAITAQFATAVSGTNVWAGTGDWFSLTNWSLRAMPGTGDVVVITNGTVSLVYPTRIGSLQVGGSAALRVASVDSVQVLGNMLLSGAASITDMSNSTLVCDGNLWLTNSAKFHVRSGAWSLPTNYNNASAPATNAYGARVQVGGLTWIQTNCAVYAYAHPTNGGTPLFCLANLTIDRGGRFDADQKGYMTQIGPGFGPGTIGTRGGAGYGGMGGICASSSSPGGPSYGSSNYPVQAGSSGSTVPGNIAAGYGGGAVRIESTGRVIVDGVMSANGGSAPDFNAGGSAGGTIYVRTRYWQGAGMVSATGGTNLSNGAGGGGGRIAIYQFSGQFTGSLSSNSVAGGISISTPTNSGQPGTLVWITLSAPGTVYTFR